MKKLICQIEELKQGQIKALVDSRMCEFERIGNSNDESIFKELCFCILTANFTAEGGIRIQREIGDGFLHLSEEKLAKELRRLGHRFPNMRARFIVAARKHANGLKHNIRQFENAKVARGWLAEEVLGLGFKEASHFLRNIGFSEVAILDFHIIDILFEYRIIRKPKTLNKRTYLQIEKKLEALAKATGLKQGELDFYLWYLETDKILK